MNSFFTQFINDIFKKRWVTHGIFWAFLLMYYTIAMYNMYGSLYISFSRNIILLLPQVLAAYYCIYYLLPAFLYKKKYVLFGILFLIGTYVFSVFARVMVIHVVESLYREPPFRQESIWEIATDIKRVYKEFFYQVYLPVFIMASIKLLKERFYEISRRELLEKEKLRAELNFMKAQIHPHFLFNTLNNLYVLTLQKSDKAPETVLKLSEMLDYMLYQCNGDRVSIAQEMQLIQNYIDLERLRYGDRLVLTFHQNIDNSQCLIAPLILVSMIENAFKHGVSGQLTAPEIKIEVCVANEQLMFSVFNTKAEHIQKDKTKFKEGIGLTNTRSQLQSIYPNQHSMEIITTKTSYEVKLLINLKA